MEGSVQSVQILVGEELHRPTFDAIARLEGVSVQLTARADALTDRPRELLGDPEILLATFPPRNLVDLERLRWIQLGSAGYEQLFGLPVAELGIAVTNASGVNDVPIAEWCLGMMFLFERDFRRVLDNQSARRWERDARFQSELRGRLVGILGYGGIGREVARQCRALGLRVWVANRGPIGTRRDRFAVEGTGDPQGVLPERRFALDELKAFLPPLDYLVLALPRTPSTEGILGERELNLLNPSAVLINPSRAELVVEDALAAALAEGRLRGAALDVHYRVPLPSEHPLWGFPNVILTPWISGSTGSRFYLARLWELFALNLNRYRQRLPLLNVISASDLVGRLAG